MGKTSCGFAQPGQLTKRAIVPAQPPLCLSALRPSRTGPVRGRCNLPRTPHASAAPAAPLLKFH
ncbi:hypothetical protein ABG768_007483, partial [Culter alburnus]